MPERIYVQTGEKRKLVSSLQPYLRESFEKKLLVDEALLEPNPTSPCSWIGYGMGKGVTHIDKPISLLLIPEKLKRGLHGKLVQGFPEVDDEEHCYNANPQKGFEHAGSYCSVCGNKTFEKPFRFCYRCGTKNPVQQPEAIHGT